MNVSPSCKDPDINVFGNPIEFSTNTFYPPGTICAKDVFQESCFFSGDSGSPLMMRFGIKDKDDFVIFLLIVDIYFSNDASSSRLYIEGFLSHIKGCNLLRLTYLSGTSILAQKTLNPSVYTKLSCHLPWIAEQYDLDFNHHGETDLECVQGAGDLMQLNNKDCRTDLYTEDPCIFPYYWKLKLNEGCTMFEDEEFIFPVFYCPIRNITRKINGRNSFVYEDIFVQVTVYLHQYLLFVY